MLIKHSIFMFQIMLFRHRVVTIYQPLEYPQNTEIQHKRIIPDKIIFFHLSLFGMSRRFFLNAVTQIFTHRNPFHFWRPSFLSKTKLLFDYLSNDFVDVFDASMKLYNMVHECQQISG